MQDSLRKRCELFADNRNSISAAFGFENSYLFPLCASLYAARNKQADIERMKECRALLKEQTGLFSNFRGTIKLATITQMALSEDPEALLGQILSLYDGLKEVLRGSEYLTIAAAAIAQMAEPDSHAVILRKTGEIYRHMKENHPFLTGSEDSAFAALLALSGLDENRIEEEMEQCYQLLKPRFFSGNAVQSLSHVLALGEASADAKCARLMELFDYLKMREHKYGTGYELPTLGVLALLPASAMTLGEQMIEADDYLKGCKGFGAFSIGARQRLMYAGMMTLCEYVPSGITMQTAAMQGVISLVIAQQAALCASAAAAAAAASSASSQ